MGAGMMAQGRRTLDGWAMRPGGGGNSGGGGGRTPASRTTHRLPHGGLQVVGLCALRRSVGRGFGCVWCP